MSAHGFQAPGPGGGSAVRSRPHSARGVAARSASGRPAAVRAARRRLVLVAVVLAALVALGVTAGYGLGRGVQAARDAWPDPVPPLEAQKVAAPDPTEVGGPSRPCPASSLTLGLTPDRPQVDEGRPVVFAVTITNSGRRPCVVDGSGVNRRITVTDAEGRVVWTSAHCTSGERQLLLGPGDVDSKTIRWSGKSSVEGECTTGQPAVPAGVYTAQVSVASVEGAVSAPVRLTVGQPAASPAPSSAPSSAPSAPAPEGGASTSAPVTPEAPAPTDPGAAAAPSPVTGQQVDAGTAPAAG
ncbi:hypothetical protein [Puerhibacterium puerhi]|uniref:hypothetical protein n=1 Tax=Puerhibacterium puerhi TaxID=2692623 RepID=UPI00135779D1|nr:hypothetical protein [Puerhibacterium puerhi]